MIVGIDLGTTNSLVAVWRDDAPQLVANALGSLITPSVVGLDDSGQVLVGQAARERLQTHPHLTASLFKRYMGSAKEITLGSRKFRSEELSALILRALKEDVERAFGEPVVEAVISVPAYFSDAQRKATRIAGELAGLKIEKLINEPTAAALAYGVHQRDKETSFLVFDLGGGTFDVSILELFEGVMEVRASAGDNFLGGEDFDTALAQHFVAAQRHDKQFPDSTAPGVRNRLQREAERVRHALGQQTSATFSLLYNERKWELPISQEELARICAELLERLRRPIERALRDARIRVADLNDILLVGGTTRMPLIRKLTATLFGRFPSIHINPDEAVALGAAVQAALKQRVGALEEVVLTDVCPYTLGIETTFEFGRQLESGHYLPIIERNTVVPVSRVKTVETLQDNQQHVRLQIYQGESRLVKDNILLGELEIPVPQRKAGEVKLDVRFTYDNNGILEAEVQLQGSPVRHNLIIEKNPGVLPPEEIHKRLQELAALKVHPREQQANTLLQARLERLYQENLGEARAMLAQMAATFQQALANEQDLKQIDELRLNILAHLDKLENSGWH